ncbi:hypothetical protein ACFQ46_09205 [Kineococcus sp. GCM10028916]|uniref:hypothetical protein n=1 Tax=Kineococcus sp. GCM10028916 TaxID=3273394 RepID=UPI0036398886
MTVSLVVGPAEHGVTAAALAQWGVVGTDPGRRLVRRVGRPDLPDVLQELDGAGPGPVLVHVTDRLFGRDADEAAAFVEGLASARDLLVTLHDLPQPSDGPVNHPRRARAYRRMAEAASAVVVSSRHEQRLLAACGVTRVADVVPLPVPRFAPSPAADPWARPVAVAVLGFLYPGKGHELVLDALDGLPAGVGLSALGRPSDGHEDLVVELTRRAHAKGRTFDVTGYVPDAELPALLRSAVIPVAPHEHLSASGSINAWIGAGRRPLVPRSDYVTELLERHPDCVRVYDDLASALVEVWSTPELSWADGPGGPTLEETVQELLAIADRLPA